MNAFYDIFTGFYCWVTYLVYKVANNLDLGVVPVAVEY